MNIAVSTVFLLFFVLPGIAFRRFYFSEQFSKEFNRPNVGELLFSAFIPSVILHSLWIGFAETELFWTRKVDIVAIIGLIQPDLSLTKIDIPKIVKNSLGHILYYFITINLAGIVCGSIVKWVIRTTKLDKGLKVFRYSNYWHYYLSAENFGFKRSRFELISSLVDRLKDGDTTISGVVEEFDNNGNTRIAKKNISITYNELKNAYNRNDIVTITGRYILDSKSLHFSGVLCDYELSPKGELETIFLTDTLYSLDGKELSASPFRKDDSLIKVKLTAFDARLISNMSLRHSIHYDHKTSDKRIRYLRTMPSIPIK